MPIIEVNLFEGRTVEQKRRLIESMTRAVVDSLDVPGDNVRIILRELSKDDLGIGGRTARDRGR